MTSEIVHYGVKGMHWGVRKDDDVSGRLQAPEPKVDPTLHPATQESAVRVASLISQRYGFTTREIVGFDPGNPGIDSNVGGASTGALGYVNITGNSKPEGDIFVSREDPRNPLKQSEKAKWVGKGCGTTEAFLTHETAHAIFHAPQHYDKDGRIVGGNVEARNKALQAAIEESIRKGVPEHLFLSKVSGYAAHAGSRQELEAELFSQYHWGTKIPSFVTVWGETLHQELGVDGTPFRKVR